MEHSPDASVPPQLPLRGLFCKITPMLMPNILTITMPIPSNRLIIIFLTPVLCPDLNENTLWDTDKVCYLQLME